MSICRYYQQGNCRFGNRCRLAHEGSYEPRGYFTSDPPFRPRVPRAPRPPSNPNYHYVAPADNRNTSRQTNPNLSAVMQWTKANFTDSEKALDVLQEIQKEAKVWQKSEHLWRFTSRSLFPGGQPLEGWADQSFEEVKWAHRWMTDQNQEHVYKKAYNDYYENIVRQLNDLATLKLDRVKSFNDYVEQYVASSYKPSNTLTTDVEMQDINRIVTATPVIQTESTNYTPDDELLETERAAYGNNTFEFGKIPVHAPSLQFVNGFNQ